MISDAQADALIRERGWKREDVEGIILGGYEDHAAFCRRMKIRNKAGVPVQMVESPSQAALSAKIRQCRRLGRPVRIVVLKARQVHFSVGSVSHVFKRTAFLPGQHSLLFGNIYDTAANLWDYAYQFTTTFQADPLGVRPLRYKHHRKDERIEWHGDSWVDVGSADSENSGRSYSIRHLLLSEFAFFRDAPRLMTGLMPTIPDDPDTTVIVESTPNGVGGPFYELCLRAQDPAAAGEWMFLFFGWHEHPEYVRPLSGDPYHFQRSLTDDEHRQQQAYGLSLEQINWRRWAITNICEGSTTRFQQEYPGNPQEAFLASGRQYFDSADLQRQSYHIMPSTTRGRLEERSIGTRKLVQLVPHDAGPLAVYRMPAPGKRYIIGADTAEGRDIGEGKGSDFDADYSVAWVADVESGEQVALFRDRCQPFPFAQWLADLGRWYNWAFQVPEVNGPGVATVQELLRLQYPVSLLYKRRREADDRRVAPLEEIGFRTTTSTRPQLLSAHYRALVEGSITIHDPAALAEHRTFVYKANGRVEHQQGCHDDTVFAGALATFGRPYAAAVFAQMAASRPAPMLDPEDVEDEKAKQGVRYRRAR